MWRIGREENWKSYGRGNVEFAPLIDEILDTQLDSVVIEFRDELS